MYKFRLCDKCGKDLLDCEISEKPAKYLYYQTIGNDDYYCTGYVSQIFCRHCSCHEE